jgi:hypothetical protein
MVLLWFRVDSEPVRLGFGAASISGNFVGLAICMQFYVHGSFSKHCGLVYKS